MKSRYRTIERPGRPIYDPQRDVRARLLDAATHLFAEQGVAATTFALIAQHAGFTPAMVPYYFKDREQLTEAVIEERLVPFIASVWDPVHPGDDPGTLLRGIVERLLAGIQRAPWIPSTWMREILNEGGLMRTGVLKRIPVEKIRIVASAIRSCQQKMSVNSELDPLLTVFSALGLVMLHMATAPVFNEIFHRHSLSTKTMRRHITALLLNGLSQPASPSAIRAPHQPRPRRTS